MSDSKPETKDDILSLRALVAVWRAELALKRYNPEQPRVPRGNPTGGEWTHSGQVAMARRLSEKECDDLFDKDNFHCKMVGLRSCYQQAAFRYADCLAGQPVRPLSY